MKRIISSILLCAMLAGSSMSLVSCSNLKEEISAVDSATVENASLIETLSQTVTALENALLVAQSDADAAIAEAKTARTEAAAATAAAATAKAEAIAEAKTQVEGFKATVYTDIDAVKSQLATLAGRLDAIDIDLKSVKETLGLKADQTALDALAAKVDINIATLENYSELLAELALADKANEEAIAAIVADLTKLQTDVAAGSESLASLQTKLENCENDMADINKKLTQFFSAIRSLINQIQSIVYVPETLEGYMAAQGYSLGDDKTDILVKATYEITPARLVWDIYSENCFFRGVTVKASEAEYFEAEIVSADDMTGRIEVYAHITPEQENAYNALSNGENISLSFNVADPKSVTMNNYGWDVEFDAGSYVASSYVGVVPAAEVFDNLLDGNVVLYNEKDCAAVSAPVQKALSAPYNLAPATKSLFGDYSVRVLVSGEYMPLEDAAYFLGMEFETENAVSVKCFDAAGAEITDSPVTVDGEGLYVTAGFVETENLKGEALIGYGAEVVADLFEVNGVAFGFPITVTYTISEMMPSPDGAQWVLPESLAMEFYGGEEAYLGSELVPAKSVLDFGMTDLTKQEMASSAIEMGILDADAKYLLLGFNEGAAFGGADEWYQLLMGLPSTYKVIPDSPTSGVVKMVVVDSWFGYETVTEIPYSNLTETSCTFDFTQWIGLGEYTAVKAENTVEVIMRG